MSTNPDEYDEEWRDTKPSGCGDGYRIAGGIMIVGDKEDARGE